MLYTHAAYGQIKLETLIAFFVLVLGCALTTPKLRQISWASRMRDSYVFRFHADMHREIDVADARPSFANVYHRGSWLFAPRDKL